MLRYLYDNFGCSENSYFAPLILIVWGQKHTEISSIRELAKLNNSIYAWSNEKSVTKLNQRKIVRKYMK